MPSGKRKGLGGWAIVGFAVLATIGFGATLRIGPKEGDEGRIVAFGYARGGVFVEFVSGRDGLKGRTPLPLHHNCKTGDVIRLERWRRVWGTGFRPADNPPCRAPFSQQ